MFNSCYLYFVIKLNDCVTLKVFLYYREKKQKIQDIKNNIKEAIEVSVKGFSYVIMQTSLTTYLRFLKGIMNTHSNCCLCFSIDYFVSNVHVGTSGSVSLSSESVSK